MSTLRSLAGRGLRAFPPARRALHRWRARRAAARIDPARPEALPVLVYQMGKVGSSTVVRTLERSLPAGRAVLPVHFMVPRELEAVRAYYRKGLGREALDRQVWLLGEALGARIAQLGDRVRLPLVSLVRDPIAREVSGLFQDPALFANRLRDASGRIDVPAALAFLAERFAAPDPCGYAEEWFDRELRVTFGIDVFDEPFDRERGWEVVRSRRVDLLLLRTEDLDRSLAPGIRELLGIEVGGIARANERAVSPDGQAYRRIWEGFRLPRETVERIYAGRLTRHFYGKDRIERFAARWCEGQGRIE